MSGKTSDGTELALAALAHYRFAGDFDSGIAKVICPLHEETQPSFWMYVADGGCHCFGCGWHGSVVQLVSTLEKVSSLKALMLLSKWHGEHAKDLRDVQSALEQVPAVFDRAPKASAEDMAARVKSLPMLCEEKGPAKRYMLDRGFELDTLSRFGIRHDRGHEYPIVIPVLMNHKLVAVQSRCLDDRRDKYRFMAGSSPSKIVAGDTKGRVVVVTEGFFDMMMAWQHMRGRDWKVMGMRVAFCSPLSWLVRPHQAAAIAGDVVVLALDNDSRGMEGAQIALDLIPNSVSFKWETAYGDVGAMDAQTFRRELVTAVRSKLGRD